MAGGSEPVDKKSLTACRQAVGEDLDGKSRVLSQDVSKSAGDAGAEHFGIYTESLCCGLFYKPVGGPDDVRIVASARYERVR